MVEYEILGLIGVIISFIGQNIQKSRNETRLEEARILSPPIQQIPISVMDSTMATLSQAIIIGYSKLIPDPIEKRLNEYYRKEQEKKGKKTPPKTKNAQEDTESLYQDPIENMLREAITGMTDPEEIQARLNEFTATTQFDLLTQLTLIATTTKENTKCLTELAKSMETVVESVENLRNRGCLQFGEHKKIVEKLEQARSDGVQIVVLEDGSKELRLEPVSEDKMNGETIEEQTDI